MYNKNNIKNINPITKKTGNQRFPFYTTNPVESFNSVLEKIRIQKGGFFQSENILNVNIYIRYLNLIKKWKKGYPKIIHKLYYLRQIFVNLYGELPYDF